MKKNSVIFVYALLVAAAVWVSNKAHADTLQSVDVVMNTAYEVSLDKDGNPVQTEYCVTTYNGVTTDFTGDCNTIHGQMLDDFSKNYPTVVINFIIDGKNYNVL